MVKKQPHKRQRPNQGADESPEPPPLLRFTAHRPDDHFLLHVRGQPVAVSVNALEAVLRLVLAVHDSASGYISLGRVTIHRLRRAIDRVLGPGAGKEIIETGCGEEYRLAIDRARLTQEVIIEPSFFELVGLGAISRHDAEALQRIFGVKPE